MPQLITQLIVTAAVITVCAAVALQQPLLANAHGPATYIPCPYFCVCRETFWKCSDSKANLWPLDNQPTAIVKGVQMLDMTGSDVNVLPNWPPTHNFPDLQMIFLSQTVFDGSRRCRELECLEKLGLRIIANRCPADLRSGCGFPPCCSWTSAQPPSQSPVSTVTESWSTTAIPRDRDSSTRAMTPTGADASGKTTAATTPFSVIIIVFHYCYTVAVDAAAAPVHCSGYHSPVHTTMDIDHPTTAVTTTTTAGGGSKLIFEKDYTINNVVITSPAHHHPHHYCP
ncbi:uncharacterized protein LOC129586472 [Paramacrobiotus metropolitanus]|uniref:uncharacterized protein LOC129586472 n=1 Tax=Paramacrobiotus metropolitanus TaxID=2943436 RepID=UPI002445CC54|nr:uncharacterized protein LOC129586472 [Paramacrobiotus metropolitanus]